MGVFYNIMLGYFFGFALGVGCALAVFYAIYSGGYRKAVEHSLQQQKPKRYLEEMAAALKRTEKEKGREGAGPERSG
jgi:lipoate-protein ligase B